MKNDISARPLYFSARLFAPLLRPLAALFFTACFFAAPGFCAAYHTITVDGDLSEWSSGENICADALDSDWDPGTDKNEIKNIFITWDASNLYIGIEGKVSGRGLILYLDSGQGNGQGDLREIRTWNRRGSFENWAPDFFFGAWDGSDGNFYRLKSSTTVEDVTTLCAIKNSKTSSRPGWEIKIPFDLLYSRGMRLPPLASVKVCASLATGDLASGDFGSYGYLGGDSAPDNAVTGLGDATLKNSVGAALDSDGDGVADDNFAGRFLSPAGVSVSPVKFSPALHGEATITVGVTKAAAVTARVYDLSGNEMKTLAEDSSSDGFKKIFRWDAKNAAGAAVASGVYIINVKAVADSESFRTNKAIVVVR